LIINKSPGSSARGEMKFDVITSSSEMAKVLTSPTNIDLKGLFGLSA
jgi:hypothetical protein